MAAKENARALELSTKSGLRQPSQGYKYLSITKIGHRSKFKWLGDFEELKLFVDGYLKITSLRSADAFPVVASLPPKNSVCEPERQSDFRDVKPFVLM